MKSFSTKQQSRYGTLTITAKLGWYEILEFHPDEDLERMLVVLPVKPSSANKMAKELRAIAKKLERSE